MSHLVAKLRYMGRQYSAGQYARGGGSQKHYLEDAADQIEQLLEVERAARRYYERYCQDEADGSEWVCGEEQRRDAQALRDALRAPVPTTEGREP